MEMLGNTLCVSFAELVGGGIISEPTYKKYVRDGKLTVVQKGGNGRKALVAYSSMFEKVRAAYDDKFQEAIHRAPTGIHSQRTGDERDGTHGKALQCGTRQVRLLPPCGNMEQRIEGMRKSAHALRTYVTNQSGKIAREVQRIQAS